MATDGSVLIPTPVNAPVQVKGEKPEKFSSVDFKRWQQKMLFYLTTLNLARFLKEEVLVLTEEKREDKTAVAAVDAWKYTNFLSEIISLTDWTTHYIMCTVR